MSGGFLVGQANDDQVVHVHKCVDALLVDVLDGGLDESGERPQRGAQAEQQDLKCVVLASPLES